MEDRLKEMCAGLDRQIGSANIRVEKAQALLAGLERHRKVLSTALEGIQRGSQPRSEAGDQSWAKLSRADAVARTLEEVGGSLPPLAISRALAEQGRSGDTPAAVSASLNYLQKKGRARWLGNGLWQAGPPELSSPGSKPAFDHPLDGHDDPSPPALADLDVVQGQLRPPPPGSSRSWITVRFG